MLLAILTTFSLFVVGNGFTNCYDKVLFKNNLFTVYQPTQTSHTDRLKSVSVMAFPKLIVFDLDNTLWTPELYTLRRIEQARSTPVAKKDVHLFDGAQEIINMIRDNQFPNDVQFGIASRTKSVDWAHNLLSQFNIRQHFSYIEIFPGDKISHFRNIHTASGIPYEDMIFFDDARHGKYGNCIPVAEMGVLAVHCPNGLQTIDIFNTALVRYQEWNKSKGVVIEWDGRMTYTKHVSSQLFDSRTERHQGLIQYVNHEKKFGFIRYEDRRTNDLYFNFKSLPANKRLVKIGDKVSFISQIDPSSNKPVAIEVKYIGTEGKGEMTSEVSDVSSIYSMISFRAFSMNMPFAALLANGHKTLETRNGTMFAPYPAGTQMLLHVGKRTYPDGDRHIEILQDGGLNNDEIVRLKALPTGFDRGMIVAICELGQTIEMTLDERNDPIIQQKVVAYGKDSGKMVTEIRRAQYLKQPIQYAGQGGVFTVKVPSNVLPDGWAKSMESK